MYSLICSINFRLYTDFFRLIAKEVPRAEWFRVTIIFLPFSGSQRGCLSGLQAKKCRAPRQKNWGSRAQWLFSRAPLSQNHYFCPGSKYKKALGSALHEKNLGAPRTPLWDPAFYYQVSSFYWFKLIEIIYEINSTLCSRRRYFESYCLKITS